MLDELEALVVKWQADPYETHKRPPYRAHSFDGDERFWIVGTTNVSVLHGFHTNEQLAIEIADLMNSYVTP
jgi:hypothetical protein